MTGYKFSMWLDVEKPAQLREAALKHPDAGDQTFLDDAGDVDIAACLETLLDPSTLPGCAISGSAAAPDFSDRIVDAELNDVVSRLESRRFQ